MKNLKIKIQDLLKNSILVSSEMKQKILANIDKYSEDQLNLFHSYLSEAELNQKILISHASKRNPLFIKDVEKSQAYGELESDLSHLLRDMSRRSEEDQVNSQENEELGNLEQQLLNM